MVLPGVREGGGSTHCARVRSRRRLASGQCPRTRARYRQPCRKSTGLVDLTWPPQGRGHRPGRRNGAGKTTALRVITGALAPEAGTVRVFGVDPTGPDGEQVRQRCGVVAAKPALYSRLSGLEPPVRRRALWVGARRPIAASADRFGHRRCPRSEGSRVFDGDEDSLGARPGHPPRARPAPAGRAHVRSGPESSHAVLRLIHGLARDGKASSCAQRPRMRIQSRHSRRRVPTGPAWVTQAGGGMGRHPAEVDTTGVELDEEQHVQPPQEHRVDAQEVGGQHPRRLGAQELSPARPGPPSGRADTRPAQDSADLRG